MTFATLSVFLGIDLNMNQYKIESSLANMSLKLKDQNESSAFKSTLVGC